MGGKSARETWRSLPSRVVDKLFAKALEDLDTSKSIGRGYYWREIGQILRSHMVVRSISVKGTRFKVRLEYVNGDGEPMGDFMRSGTIEDPISYDGIVTEIWQALTFPPMVRASKVVSSPIKVDYDGEIMIGQIVSVLCKDDLFFFFDRCDGYPMALIRPDVSDYIRRVLSMIDLGSIVCALGLTDEDLMRAWAPVWSARIAEKLVRLLARESRKNRVTVRMLPHGEERSVAVIWIGDLLRQARSEFLAQSIARPKGPFGIEV